LPDIITVGEALINFVSTEPGLPLGESLTFKKTIGGTPASVAVGLARLGVSAGLIGRVGDDPFGHFLADTLAAQGVHVEQLGFERKARTGVVFTPRTREGKSDLLIFRHPSADTLLSPGHINPGYVKSARAIVYSSVGLIAEPCRSGVFKALAIAREARVIRVYDAILYRSLWGTDSEARYGLHLGLDRAEIVRLGLDEMEFLSGTRELQQGTEVVWSNLVSTGNRIRLLIVTLGTQGCAYRIPTGFGQLPGYPVEALDMTGAADAFLAGLLAELLANHIAFEQEKIEPALRFANAAAALTTIQAGTLSGLPTRSEVEVFLDSANLP
jgi:fructokinase